MSSRQVRTVQVTAAQLVAPDVCLDLRVLAGSKGLARRISAPRIQKPGLALTGWDEQLHEERLLVLGATELQYLEAVMPEARALAVATMLSSHPAAIVVSRGLEPPLELVAGCDETDVPLFVSGLQS